MAIQQSKLVLDLSRTYVILPVYNRKNVSERCLRHLQCQEIFPLANIVVVDDGSTDGTREMVASLFPTAHLLLGNGDLWWTGAIRCGMDYAMKMGAQTIIWLNDDTLPQLGTLFRIVQHSQAHGCITSARSRYMLKEPPEPILGLYKRTFSLVQAIGPVDSDGAMVVDALRGNCLAIPIEIVNAIGLPDDKGLPHYHGDSDYTLRATRFGFQCVMLMDAWADEIADRGDRDVSWLHGDIPLRTLWKRFFFKGCGYYWKANLVYSYRHFGILAGTIRFLKPAIWMLAVTLIRSSTGKRLN